MKKSNISILLALVILIASSCSKEKRLEKNLEKVKTWNIAKISYQKAQAGFSGTNAKIGVEYDAGTMTFNDDGTGDYDYVIDGYHRVGTYNWTLTANDITFNYATASLNGAHAATYNVIHESNSSITFQGDEALVDSNGTFAMNAIFYLKK